MGTIQTYIHPDSLPGSFRPVITVGTFDGVHLGHRTILDRINEMALKDHCESMVVTFDPHPRIALGKDAERLRLLNTLEEKTVLLEKAGIRHLVVLRFTPDFAALTEQKFIEDYLVKKFRICRLVVGFNHRFGHDRQGDFETLKKLGAKFDFEVEMISKKELGDKTISSTQIRNALAQGDLPLANAMLGYLYPLTATVVHGQKNGRALGFPTANLRVDHPYKLIPAQGVYAVYVLLQGKRHLGMCNIGQRPTFNQSEQVAEVNIFNLEGDIYGAPIEVQFVERMREEIRFDTPEALKQQLQHDKEKALKILNHQSNTPGR